MYEESAICFKITMWSWVLVPDVLTMIVKYSILNGTEQNLCVSPLPGTERNSRKILLSQHNFHINIL